MNDAEIGARIALRRAELGWSQQALADELRQAGMTWMRQTTVSRTEAGDRSLRLTEAVQVAAVLGVDLNFLLGDRRSVTTAHELIVARQAIRRALAALE